MKFFSLIFALITFSAFSQNAMLSGSIKNPYQDKVYLFSYAPPDWKKVIIDSAVLDNGKFKMDFSVDSLTNLVFNDGNEFAQIYVAPGENLKLELNTRFFDESLIFSGDGAERNNAIKSFYIVSEMQDFKVSNLFDPETELADSTKLLEKIVEINEETAQYAEDLKMGCPEMSGFLEQEINRLRDEKTARFELSSHFLGIRFKKMKEKELGTDFMTVTGFDLQGKEIKISDFYGKPVVLDFWATWCGPCKKEIPYLKELEEEWGDDVNVISICVWSKKDTWEKMAKEFGFKHDIFLSKEMTQLVAERYIIEYIPRYIILDKNGKIVSLSAARPSGDMNIEVEEMLSER